MLNTRNLNIETSRTQTVLIVLGGLISIYLLINLALSHVFSGFVSAYVIQPLLWVTLAGLVWLLPRYRTAARPRLHQTLIMLAVVIGFCQVLFSVMAGILSGFGNSPSSFTPKGITINVVFVGTALIGMELSRACLVSRLSKHRTVLILGLVALLFTLLEIPLRRLTGIGEPRATVEFMGSTILPSLAQNLLACFLAYLGGPLPAIGYRAMLLAFEWFSPVLPDLSWALTALVGTITPAMGFMAVQSFHNSELRPRLPRSHAKTNSSPVKLTVMAVGVISIVWFSVGLLPFYPATVLTGSMRSTIEVGDMLIVSKVPVDSIKKGDIVEYRTTDKSIIHRVVAIDQTSGGKTFTTKGDANSNPDEAPVLPSQIKGKVILTIPKIGWASLKIKSLLGLN